MASSDESSIIIPKNFIFSHLMFHRERGDITRTHWEDNNEYSPKKVRRGLILQPNLSTNNQISGRLNVARELYTRNVLEESFITGINPEVNQIDASEFFRVNNSRQIRPSLEINPVPGDGMLD
jgi:hypothetical protein